MVQVFTVRIKCYYSTDHTQVLRMFFFPLHLEHVNQKQFASNIEKVNKEQHWQVQAGDGYKLDSIIEHEVKQKKI